jgi:sulfate adenylyltransferase subunit 2
MNAYYLSHLKELEGEAIFAIREVVAQFERPCLLFSGGKDSIVLSYLSRKAFYPARIPFPLVHIDTGHNFPETMRYRDALVQELQVQLVVGSVQESIDRGRVAEERGMHANRNALQSVTLLDTLTLHKFDAAMGGARRDEEKARAKERFFSHRDEFGQWDPKNQRPEIWNLFNGRKRPGEHFRVFPISNWTELDVWEYIAMENLPIPSLYFAHEREVIVRQDTILSTSPWLMLRDDEVPQQMRVRFRTCGDMPITGAISSDADSLERIIEEIASSRKTERGTRADDKRSETAMEDRKKVGYF